MKLQNLNSTARQHSGTTASIIYLLSSLQLHTSLSTGSWRGIIKLQESTTKLSAGCMQYQHITEADLSSLLTHTLLTVCLWLALKKIIAGGRILQGFQIHESVLSHLLAPFNLSM